MGSRKRLNQESEAGVTWICQHPLAPASRVRLMVSRVLECDFALFRSTRTGTRCYTCLTRIFRYLAVPASLLSC